MFHLLSPPDLFFQQLNGPRMREVRKTTASVGLLLFIFDRIHRRAGSTLTPALDRQTVRWPIVLLISRRLLLITILSLRRKQRQLSDMLEPAPQPERALIPEGTPQAVTNSMLLHRLLEQAKYPYFEWKNIQKNHEGVAYHCVSFYLGDQHFGTSRKWHRCLTDAKEDAAEVALPYVQAWLTSIGFR